MKLTKFKEEQITHKHKMVTEALAKSNGNKSRAAESLGIDRKTLYNIIYQYEKIKKAA